MSPRSAFSDYSDEPRRRAVEEAFWRRYAQALEQAGVPEKRRLWYQRDCERFVVWLQPKRFITRIAPNKPTWNGFTVS